MSFSRSALPSVLLALTGVLLLCIGLALGITAISAHFFGEFAETHDSASAPEAPHIDLSGFNPGYIISDEHFYNYESMDLAAIESFIAEKNAGCQTISTVCLNAYREDTVDIPASPHCAGYRGAPGESAAEIISKTAQSCRVNPQVLLTLLQKEQSLLTASGLELNPTRYDTATGYGCPDNHECNPEYFGLGKQIYFAAAQFQRYRQNPAQFIYRAGNTHNIPFSSNPACGSAAVKIENQATAALYNYTPYQPDPALLEGNPGKCSSYGNANFYGIYKAWFGDPTR